MTDAGRLTRMDEYPRHQVGGTFDSVVSDSVHWNDGFYFTLGDEATGATLFAAIRLYPNTDVIDGFACVTIDRTSSTTCAGPGGCARASTTSPSARSPSRSSSR